MLNLKKLFSSLILLGLSTVVFAIMFQPADAQPMVDIVQTETLANRSPLASSPMGLMASAVRMHVTISSTRLVDENNPVEQPVTEEWSGSGVVYGKTDGKQGPVRSRILSANHVLETPAIGSVHDDVVEFLGMKFNLGKIRTDSVKVELQTADGRICDVTVLALGSSDTRDTATAEANCDAGPVAELATFVPVMGEKIFIVGYSQGVTLPMLTEGYVSGWMDGYLLTSAPAFGGNSGGPVFYNGKVIGLLVRGNRSYPNLTLTVSLEECWRRIAETPPL